MPEFSAAIYDFAILAHADVELEVVAEQIAEVQERYRSFNPTVELFGRTENGQVLLLYRFPFAAYSGALRQKMERQSQRLKGRLIEPHLLEESDRHRFYSDRLKAYDVHVDATGHVKEAIAVFREGMGLVHGAAHVYQLAFASPDDVASAYARCIAEGSLFVPSRKPPNIGSEVSLVFLVPGQAPMEAKGQVIEHRVDGRDGAGFRASIVPGDALVRFVSRRSASAHAGKVVGPAGGRRIHTRYEACLDVEFSDYPSLAGEFASNISRGGMFIRTEKPVPVRSKVRVQVKLPDGSSASTEAEVVHLVTREDARARGTSPGLGVSFSEHDAAFLAQFERCLQALPRRRSRVLVVDDDRFFLTVLSDALLKVGMDAESARTGEEAMERLTQSLFELDLMVLDLHIPGMDGFSLLDRIRRLGGELDLKIAVLSAASPAALERAIKSGANDAIAKSTPLDEIVLRLQRLLGSLPPV